MQKLPERSRKTLSLTTRCRADPARLECPQQEPDGVRDLRGASAEAARNGHQLNEAVAKRAAGLAFADAQPRRENKFKVELGNVGTNAAIGSAVYHATGIRVRELAIRLEKLLDAPAIAL